MYAIRSYYEVNLGVGEAKGKPPHVTGADFLKMFNIQPNTPDAYALTYDNFVDLAKSYGKMGGMDRVSTVVKAIRRITSYNVCYTKLLRDMPTPPQFRAKHCPGPSGLAAVHLVNQRNHTCGALVTQ